MSDNENSGVEGYSKEELDKIDKEDKMRREITAELEKIVKENIAKIKKDPDNDAIVAVANQLVFDKLEDLNSEEERSQWQKRWQELKNELGQAHQDLKERMQVYGLSGSIAEFKKNQLDNEKN